VPPNDSSKQATTQKDTAVICFQFKKLQPNPSVSSLYYNTTLCPSFKVISLSVDKTWLFWDFLHLCYSEEEQHWAPDMLNGLKMG